MGVLGGEDLRAVHRNTLRLLKLVNALLDFSRIEAGRARRRTADRSRLVTRDLASASGRPSSAAACASRSTARRSPRPVFVDRDMWEKIVLNLLSNAFKFTFEGDDRVACAPRRRRRARGEDTGVGIPEHELPRVFERFQRIEGAAARTHEGPASASRSCATSSSCTAEAIAVSSRAGVGTTFTVSIPLGAAHLPAARGRRARAASTAMGAEPFVQEAAALGAFGRTRRPELRPAPESAAARAHPHAPMTTRTCAST
jgi:signal transduction histidine kinase